MSHTGQPAYSQPDAQRYVFGGTKASPSVIPPQQQWRQNQPRTWQHGQGTPPRPHQPAETYGQPQQPTGPVNLGVLLDKYFRVRGKEFLREMNQRLEEHASKSSNLESASGKPTRLIESSENINIRDLIEQVQENILHMQERIEQAQGRIEEINRKGLEIDRKVEEVPDKVAKMMQPANEKTHHVVMELKEKFETGLSEIIKTEMGEVFKIVQAASEARQEGSGVGRELTKVECQSDGVGSRPAHRRKSERLKKKRRENPAVCHSCKSEFKLENGNKRRNNKRGNQNVECLSCGEPVHMCIKCIRRIYRYA
jgi:hypothetical protein